MRDIGGELAIVHWLTGVELVFILQANNNLVDQRHAQAGYLSQGSSFYRRPLAV